MTKINAKLLPDSKCLNNRCIVFIDGAIAGIADFSSSYVFYFGNFTLTWNEFECRILNYLFYYGNKSKYSKRRFIFLRLIF